MIAILILRSLLDNINESWRARSDNLLYNFDVVRACIKRAYALRMYDCKITSRSDALKSKDVCVCNFLQANKICRCPIRVPFFCYLAHIIIT